MSIRMPDTGTDEPQQISVNGRAAWRWPDGRIHPVVSGGMDDGGDAAGAEEVRDGDTTDQVIDDATDTDAVDWKAEADKFKALHRKQEERAKANADAAKRLAEIEEANATDLEKAVKAARDEGRSEVLTAANSRLINAEARAAAAELRFKNPALAIKAVDLSSVEVGEDGEVDSAAVRAALEELAKHEPYLIGDGRPKGDADQGARTTAKPEATPGMGRLRAAYANSDQ